MRTADEIMDDLGIYLQNDGDENSVKEAINEARKESIKECAEIAEGIEGWSTGLRKEKILSLIKELK